MRLKVGCVAAWATAFRSHCCWDSLRCVVSGFLCGLDANTYGLTFDSFVMKDYDTKEVIFEISADSPLPALDLEGDFDEDSLRRIRYDFSVDVLRKETVSTTYVPSATLLRDSGTVDRGLCWQPGVLEWAGTTRRLPYDRAPLLPRRADQELRLRLWVCNSQHYQHLGERIHAAHAPGVVECVALAVQRAAIDLTLCAVLHSRRDHPASIRSEV